MKRPRICLAAPPYSGHLHPILGLAKELESVAEVIVISTPGVGDSVRASGFEFRPVLGERERMIWEIATPGHAVKSNPLKLFRQLRANVELQAEALHVFGELFDELRPDLVIADFTLPVAGQAAKLRGIRWWSSVPSPCVIETPDGPPAYFGGLMPAESVAEKAIHALLRKVTRVFKRVMFFLFRKSFRRAGFESVYREDGSERVYSDEMILGVGLPELEFAREFPEVFRFIGALTFTPTVARVAPEFVAGKKHVLVTLGTHLTHRKEALAGRIREMAPRFPDWVFHFSDGVDNGRGREVEGNFHRHPFVSYADHLPGYDLVVHHGGSGVAWHCLAHGIPAVVLPMDFDQFDYASRLSAAGVAIRMEREDELEAAIAVAMSDDRLRERAGYFSELTAERSPGEIVRQLLREAFWE